MQFRINYNGVILGKIFPSEKIPSKTDNRSWSKRDIIIKWTEEGTGNREDKDQYRRIECFGKPADALDQFKEGDVVDVQARLQGNMWRKTREDEWQCFNKDSLEAITRAHTGFQEDAPQESYDSDDNYDPAQDLPF